MENLERSTQMMKGTQAREQDDENVNEDEGPFSKQRKRGLTSLLHDITSERKQQLDPHRNKTQSPSTLNLLQNEFLLYDQLKEQSADTEDPSD